EMRDPGLDLPLALALASFVMETALPKSFCAFGEIGLGGEIRPVEYTEQRIKSAKLMGFETIAGPKLPKAVDAYAMETPDEQRDAEDYSGLAESEPPGAIQDPDDDDESAGGDDRYMPFSTLSEALAAILDLSTQQKKTKTADKPKRRKKKSAQAREKEDG